MWLDLMNFIVSPQNLRRNAMKNTVVLITGALLGQGVTEVDATAEVRMVQHNKTALVNRQARRRRRCNRVRGF
jgi:hypothetical protein